MRTYQFLYPKDTVSRRTVSLDGMWKFCLDKKRQGYDNEWIDGLPGSEMIPVPASFQDFYTDKNIRKYTGDFWYERDFFVPGEWEGKEVAIRFGCATYRAEVYVNGIKVAFHEGGFLPILAVITEIVRYNAYNKVVVLVNNEWKDSNIYPFHYAGLHRCVNLIAYPKEHIEDFSLAYEWEGNDAVVHYQIETTSSLPVEVEIYEQNLKKVAHAAGKEGTLRIRNVHKWGIGDGYLYRLEIKLMNGSCVADEYYDHIGIRTVEIRGKELLLNGEKVYLKGFEKRDDSDDIGRGFQYGVMKKDFACIKWIGANCIRTSHFPYSEEIYQMADREGILIIDDVPASEIFKNSLYVINASGKDPPSFRQKRTVPQLLEKHLQAVEEMITRDKNHACVIAWNLLDEPDAANEAESPCFEKIFALARRLDPQNRPCTCSMRMDSFPESSKCRQFCDLILLNGYHDSRLKGDGNLADAEGFFRKEMEKWKTLDPVKPFVFTEYDACAGLAEEKNPAFVYTQKERIAYLEMCHRILDSCDFTTGELVWNFADIQAAEDFSKNREGVFTRQRKPRKTAYYLKKRWNNE